MDAEITVELPSIAQSETTVALLPVLLIPNAPDGGITVAFPEEFVYKPPPRPTIERCALPLSLTHTLSHSHPHMLTQRSHTRLTTCLHTPR